MTPIQRKVKISIVITALSLWVTPIFGQTLRILPLGNSITQGWMGESLSQSDRIGYRCELYNLLTQAGYNIDMVGSEQAGWNIMTDYEHGGWPSIRDNEVADIMETGYTPDYGYQAPGAYLNEYPADIILLHIGTNDVWGNDLNGAPSVERILDAVDDYETSSGNDVLVLLAKIISHSGATCTSYPDATTYNNSVVSMAQARINNDNDKIVIVDMQCGAGIDYTDDMYDGWHPNETGYAKMGQKWFNVINNLNTKPTFISIPNQTINEGENFNQINLDGYISDPETSDANMDWHYIQSPGSELQISLSADRKITITPPDENWNGTESVKFFAFDDGKYIEKLKKSSDTVEVVFTVNPVPDAPVIDSLTEPLSVNEDESIKLSLEDFVVTDPDNIYPDEHTLILAEGSNYTLSGDTVKPDPDFNGTFSVPVVIKDNEETESDIYYALITVIPVNDPPEINEPKNLNAETGRLYNDSVEIFDLDAEDTPILNVLSVPDWLTVNTSTRILSGIPKSSDVGNNKVTLEVSDGKVTVQKEFNIVVTPEVDINELVHSTDVFIYPNPANDFVTISFNDRIKECELLVYSLSGTLMYSDKSFNKKELQYNLDEINIHPGMYVVNLILNNSEFLYFKLVVNE